MCCLALALAMYLEARNGQAYVQHCTNGLDLDVLLDLAEMIKTKKTVRTSSYGS